MPESESYSVYWWDDHDRYVREVDGVGAEDAVRSAHGIANSVGAKVGVVRRIIITNNFDECEWLAGGGIVFPPELRGPALPCPPRQP